MINVFTSGGIKSMRIPYMLAHSEDYIYLGVLQAIYR